MDDNWRPDQQQSSKSSRRGKTILLILIASFCLVASYVAHAADITADTHRTSLIIGAFLGIVNFTLIISVIAAAIFFMADLSEG
ncbi:MAG: hypothetical protein R3293_23160 [Candidatus Promineifilaceae bacterium]|nr:hypothetical protein [Candidatus Promineifilaceae bacterium]